MQFTHDTECSLQATAALVNTVDVDGCGVEDPASDRLTTIAALQTFLDENAFSGRRDRDRAEVDAVRALRPRLRRLWACDTDALVVEVNALLAEARALPQLVRHDGWDYYHLHATSSQETVAVRMAVEAAMALVDVIRAQETDRLRTCAADDCEGVVVDLSRNRSRRYCEAGCGNRVAVAAYRARRTTERSAG